MITTANIYTSIKELIPKILKSGNIFQHNGADHFDIYEGRMERITVTDKPTIFFHSVDIATPLSQIATCFRDKEISFRIGVKCLESESTIREGYLWQVNRLVELFTPDVLFSIPFSFTIAGQTLSNESLAKIGITDATCSGMVEYRDNDCDCYVAEMACSFTFSLSSPIK